MKRTFLAVLVVSVMTIWARGSVAQTITLRLGHVGFPGSLFAITTDEYAKRVNATLKGKVEVKVFHSSQLGSDEQMIRGSKVGAPEMFLPSTIMSTVEQRFGVFERP
jgi:TRAP-type transport system periplasmic protein